MNRLASIARWGGGLAVAVGLLLPQTASGQGLVVQTSASSQVVPDTSANIANNQIILVAWGGRHADAVGVEVDQNLTSPRSELVFVA